MEKLVQLILLLLKRTQEGKIDWERSARDDFFQAALPGFTVQIGEKTAQEGLDYVLLIYNDDNELVEQVRDPQLTDHMESPFETMRELHFSARRKAMGVDKALESLLQSLVEEEKPPF